MAANCLQLRLAKGQFAFLAQKRTVCAQNTVGNVFYCVYQRAQTGKTRGFAPLSDGLDQICAFTRMERLGSIR